MKRQIVIIIAIACILTTAIVVWMRQNQFSESLPPGLRWFSNVRSIPIVSTANEPAGDWSWAIAIILELQDGAQVMPVFRIRQPFSDAPGSREVLANPIWLPPTPNTFVYLPDDDAIAVVHVLILAARRGLIEEDVWRVLTLSRDEIVSSDRIYVPALRTLPALDSLPEGEDWQGLLQSASTWYREQSK